MYLSSYVREMPDYSIQQVEQAEYQIPKNLGDFPKPNNTLAWVSMLIVIGLIYHNIN